MSQTTGEFRPIDGPELFFAIVGAAGTDHDAAVGLLERGLKKLRYETERVRLSELIKQALSININEDKKFDEAVGQLMDAGDSLRKIYGRGDAAALLGIADIKRRRRKKTGSDEKFPNRVAYIIRSLKTPEEVETLRHVYGRALRVVSVYSPKERRTKNLAQKIAQSYGAIDLEPHMPKALQLIQRDEAGYEKETPNGQNVRGAFPLADLFVDESDKDGMKNSINRFLDLIFGNPFFTPTKDEYGAFFAHSASLRSADLSRQVGAVIMNKEGSLVSSGCNEVPKSNGGSYWEGDKPDRRDFKLGYDPSARMKTKMMEEIFRVLKDEKWLSKDLMNRQVAEIVGQAQAKDGGILRDVKLSHILEFGRVVHAEMSAITDAARRGVQTQGQSLYCTTFPCHNCARHIISAGIERVVFIEPYPKSMTLDLYEDEVTFERKRVDGKVQFEPFVGVAPNSFAELFSAPKRKSESGQSIEWQPEMAKPRLKRFVASYMLIESVAIALLGGQNGGVRGKPKERNGRKLVRKLARGRSKERSGPSS